MLVVLLAEKLLELLVLVVEQVLELELLRFWLEAEQTLVVVEASFPVVAYVVVVEDNRMVHQMRHRMAYHMEDKRQMVVVRRNLRHPLGNHLVVEVVGAVEVVELLLVEFEAQLVEVLEQHQKLVLALVHKLLNHECQIP